MNKLSIVVANYNNGKYLESCIDSIFSSKANFPFEVVIIDDCSTDNSKEVIDILSNKYNNVRSIFKEKNLSVGHTRNMAFYEIESEYILNFDADDYFINDFLETLSNIDSNWADIIVYDFYHDFFRSNEKFNYDNIENFQKKLEWQSLVNKIIKRSLVIDNNIKFLDTNMYDDVSGLINIRFMAKSVYNINKSLMNYRYNNSSLVHSMFKEKDINDMKNDTHRQLKNVIIHVINQSKNNIEVFEYSKRVYKMNVHYTFLEEGIEEIGMFYSRREYMWTPYKAATFLGLWLLFNSKITLKLIWFWNYIRGK